MQLCEICVQLDDLYGVEYLDSHLLFMCRFVILVYIWCHLGFAKCTFKFFKFKFIFKILICCVNFGLQQRDQGSNLHP
jgi:hypothetical protein